MALGTALAIGATVAGSVLSSSKASSNANKAADASVQAARENNALTKEIYQQNKGVLAPFVETGANAGALLNDFYGIPQATAAPATGALASYGVQSGPDYAAYVQANPDLVRDFQKVAGKYGNDASAYGEYHWNRYGQFEPGRTLPNSTPQAVTAGPATASVTPSAKSAFADYIANSDYAFQQQEGGNQINSGYAGAGTVQSGDAMKALERYRQNLQSGYRQQWAGGVASQQGVGLSAAGALAGVSTNYANTVAASNTAAADARANAALSQQSIFGNGLGTLGAGILKGFG